MAICPECGGVIAEGKRFCPNCGARMDAPKVIPEQEVHRASPFGQDERVPLGDDRPERSFYGEADRESADLWATDRTRMPREVPDGRRRQNGVDFDPITRKGRSSEQSVFRDRDAWDQAEERAYPRSTDYDESVFMAKRERHPVSAQGKRTASRQPKPAAQNRPGGSLLRPGECLLSMLLAIIPLVGLIIGIVWAKAKPNPNRRNLSIAMVVFNILEILLGGIGFVIFKLLI